MFNTFTLHVPVHPVSISVPIESPAPPASPDRIVYVLDDDPAVCSALQLLARVCGWRARGFESGPDFLSSNIDPTSGCLVLDLNMPQMDGEEVLRRLRQSGSRLPVIVITGDGQGARLERMRRLGAQEVLQKPFSDHLFQEAVQRCLAAPTAAGHATEVAAQPPPVGADGPTVVSGSGRFCGFQ